MTDNPFSDIPHTGNVPWTLQALAGNLVQLRQRSYRVEDRRSCRLLLANLGCMFEVEVPQGDGRCPEFEFSPCDSPAPEALVARQLPLLCRSPAEGYRGWRDVSVYSLSAEDQYQVCPRWLPNGWRPRHESPMASGTSWALDVLCDLPQHVSLGDARVCLQQKGA